MNTVGFDFAAQMIQRGKRNYPIFDLRTTQGIPRDEVAASFDGILLLGALTCIPDDQGQALLIAGLR
jgi:hypothetical protein